MYSYTSSITVHDTKTRTYTHARTHKAGRRTLACRAYVRLGVAGDDPGGVELVAREADLRPAQQHLLLGRVVQERPAAPSPPAAGRAGGIGGGGVGVLGEEQARLPAAAGGRRR